jgi:hypothetical protein
VSESIDRMAASQTPKPRDEDIDVYGLTHVGKVRKENQDHFLIGSLSKRMDVDHTSLPAEATLAVEPERLASLAMVADGVGRGGGGEIPIGSGTGPRSRCGSASGRTPTCYRWVTAVPTCTAMAS